MSYVSRFWALVISGILVLASVVAFWVATKLKAPWGDVVNSIASAVLSIGALSVVYELFMRQHIHQELIDLVGVERSVARSGLMSITSYDEINWIDALARAERVSVLLSKGDRWIGSAFTRIVDMATRRAISVEIALPSATSPANATFAAFFAMNATEFADISRRSAAQIEATWKARADIRAGSLLRLRTYDTFLTGGIVIIDQSVFLLSNLPGGVVDGEVEVLVALEFDSSSSAFPVSAITSQYGRILGDAITLYENLRS